MTPNDITLWQSPNGIDIDRTASRDINILTEYINEKIIPSRDIIQIQKAYSAELYPMATEFTWVRAINFLKTKIMGFGREFVLEMLGRSDDNLGEDFLTEIDTINLAADLGFINKTAKMYFMQSREVIQHFLNPDIDFEMDELDSLKTIKTCVQYVLALDDVEMEFSYNNFRARLVDEIISEDDAIVKNLIIGPYFFKRTTVRTLLNLAKTYSEGAEKEKVLSNTVIIISAIWDGLLSEDKWPIGFAYAEAINMGKRDIIKALKSLLLKVKGFDYVPENLRSTSFIDVANLLLTTHYGMDNFHKEYIPAKQLSQMGTSIPKPAIGRCMTAVIACKLGNSHGRANSAQVYLDKILDNLIPGSWSYYVNEVLYADEDILQKLSTNTRMLSKWLELIGEYKVELEDITVSDRFVRKLVEESLNSNSKGIISASQKLLGELR